MDAPVPTASIDPTVVLLIVAVIVALGVAMILRRRQRENVSVQSKQPEQPEQPRQGPLPDGNDPELMALLNDGQTIMAIKLVRERMGLGLKEAKDHVERLE